MHGQTRRTTRADAEAGDFCGDRRCHDAKHPMAWIRWNNDESCKAMAAADDQRGNFDVKNGMVGH
jgi:hypothetical protein